MSTPAPERILEALAHGINGRPEEGLRLIQPLVDAGPLSTYALLGSLAETASRDGRYASGAGTLFAIEVQGPDGPASTNDVPTPLRFAAQFTTAWAARDQDTAYALFWAFAEPSDRLGTDDLAEGIGLLFDMAVLGEKAALMERRQRAADEQR